MSAPTVIFEDEYLAVIDKPAGMIVNRSDTAKNVLTLQDFLEEEFKMKKQKLEENEINKDFINRSGLVHRLDKETSGLILHAKNLETFLGLQRQFKEGKVEKTYIALVHGKIPNEQGVIDVPVGRLPWDRKKFGVIPMGRESKTFYKVLEYKFFEEGKNKETLTLVEVRPKTGRTHQIRVHFRYFGFPIFGDSLYAGRQNIKRDRKYLQRHFLHAKQIKFTHPKTDEILGFSSDLPQDLVDFLLFLK